VASGSAIQSCRDLKVWQEAMNLAVDCYRVSRDFPRDELYGITSQVRRSATSVAANVAEGYGRESRGAYVQFLKTAQGSLKELETHLILSQRVGLTGEDKVAPLLARAGDVGRMLRSLIRRLENEGGGS
jgi:four helix bundle protein